MTGVRVVTSSHIYSQKHRRRLATRSPSFLLQQERLHEQEAKLSTQEEQIALLKARLDALELAPTADRPQVI